MDQLPAELNLVTFNCWGLRYGLSKLRTERLIEIGRQLASLDPPPHIVALQECWSEAEDYDAIRRETCSILPFGKFYHAGAFGSGLAILSRWPIEESSMIRFPLSGRPTAFFRGDWFVGKGVACAAVRFGPGPRHVVQVFNTHLHAGYREVFDSYDTYACHRMSQAWELAKLIRAASERGRLVVAMGDFNTVPSSIPYRLFTAHAPVRDTWRLLHPGSRPCPRPPSSSPPPLLPLAATDPEQQQQQYQLPPSPSFNVSEHGVTIKSVLNTWAWTKRQRRNLIGPEKMPCRVPPDAVDNRARRIDYIFVGHSNPAPPLYQSVNDDPSSSVTKNSHANSPDSDEASVWVLRDASVGMTKRHPLLDVSLSDHFSVQATIKLETLDSQPGPSSNAHPSSPNGANGANGLRGGRGSTPAADAITVDDSIIRNGAFLQTNSPTPSEFHPEETSVQYPLTAPPMDPQFEFSASSYDQVLVAINQYRARELSQRRWRSIHFFGSLFICAGCLVAVCFSPENWVSFILMLVAILSITAGTVDGLLALLFFNAELRALSEFEWEIAHAKAAALGLGGRSSRDGSEDQK